LRFRVLCPQVCGRAIDAGVCAWCASAPSTRTGLVVSAIAVVGDEVRELVRRRGIDPIEQPGAVRRLVDEVLACRVMLRVGRLPGEQRVLR
jgi:hypothetical protein